MTTQLALDFAEPGTVNPFHCGRCGAHPDTVVFEGDLWRRPWAGVSLWRCPCGFKWQWPWDDRHAPVESPRRRRCPVCDGPEDPGALPDEMFPTVHSDLGDLPCPACSATVSWGVVHPGRRFTCYPCSITESDARREALR